MGMTAYFLDTNVLVYAFAQDDPRKRGIARALAESGEASISTQVLSELANVLTRRLRFSPSETRGRVAGIAASCEVVMVTPSIVGDALRIMERYQYSFYDSQILAAALAAGVKVLYSEDLQREQIIDGTLTIRSPFQLSVQQRPGPYAVKRRGRGRSQQSRNAAADEGGP